ncbi:hypothetical protein BGZ96_009547 [Linnemannia gamsii]|uniref:glutathione transferase n=1 Tax=Linnemannia gamsii TaxID=64522 RepID=A0ABQ7JW74_9FUNG|nr:hypothetical protein BGZ96_009547 [Linnemannia gamsii]
MVHAFFNPAQADKFNALAGRRDTTFIVTYFGIHGLGGVTRTLLAISGQKFTSINPEDWATNEKLKAPFGSMPLLAETSADGKTTIQIAESDAIERYLSKKIGLLGSNAFEETLINTFVSNAQFLQHAILSKYMTVKDPEVKAVNKEPLITANIVPWIKNNEQHLAANGSNGHFVGNKVTLADIKAVFLMDLIGCVTGDELISKSKTPAIWAVREELDKVENLAAWKKTEMYKDLSEKNFAALGFY